MKGIHGEDFARQPEVFDKDTQGCPFAGLAILKRFHPIDHAAVVAERTDNGDEILKFRVATANRRGYGLPVQGHEAVGQWWMVRFGPGSEFLSQKLLIQTCQN